MKNGSAAKMMNDLPDIHVDDLVEFMAYLEPQPPITTEFSKGRQRAKKVPLDVKMYPHQKSHMINWFAGQVTKGSGQYVRKEGNTSARITYDRFLNQYGLLWLAEVLGEEEQTLRKAMRDAAAAEKINYRNRCNAFRKVISFDRVLELFLNPGGWIYDKRIKPLLEFDNDSGAPFVQDEHEREFMDILAAEKCI